MIRIPRGCPANIRSEVLAAFGAFWSDLAACLNHIRQAIELLLTLMGVPRGKAVGKKAKTVVRRSLHDRIKWLSQGKGLDAEPHATTDEKRDDKPACMT